MLLYQAELSKLRKVVLWKFSIPLPLLRSFILNVYITNCNALDNNYFDHKRNRNIYFFPSNYDKRMLFHCSVGYVFLEVLFRERVGRHNIGDMKRHCDNICFTFSLGSNVISVDEIKSIFIQRFIRVQYFSKRSMYLIIIQN